ncbi:uncharacterized protein LOC120840800 [Ixodes scapularis]|uniref:uncharacterized protein LOC120840800 n=1 Tax=Ixodes scapularis TaxID=6945 RepID=UPI001C38121F|nr:uncharacterized protein LOC120840800 [Ixodes scapularis]
MRRQPVSRQGASDEAAQDTTPGQAPTVASATTILCAGALRQRDPKLFSGIGDDDIEDWLESVERVSLHNKWDDTVKLNNVIFYLTDVAKLWYTNHESELVTWPQFKAKIQEVFGKPAQRKLVAKRTLASRTQLHDESFVSYIEDVLKLCKRVDTRMTEDEKLKNIMKGIAEDAFQILVVKAPTTVSEVIDICQNFSELRLQRLPAKRKLEPPAELASLTTAIEGSVDKWAELRCVIQEIVRDEVARQLGKPSTPPESFISPSIRALIEDQVKAAIPCAVMPPAASPPLVPQVPTRHFLLLAGKHAGLTNGGRQKIVPFAFHVAMLGISPVFVAVETLRVTLPHCKRSIDQLSVLVDAVISIHTKITLNHNHGKGRLPEI